MYNEDQNIDNYKNYLNNCLINIGQEVRKCKMGYSEYDKRVLPIVLVAMILISIILAMVLRRKSWRIRSIPTAIIAIVMIFIEIIKQRCNILGEFNYYYLPFHYCSLFLIVFPLAELCGEKLSRIFRPVATCMAFIVSVAMYVFPSGIIDGASELFGKDFYKTHTFIFHHLLVLYVLLVSSMQLCKVRFRDAVNVGAIGLVYLVVAIPIANKFQENYCNLLYSVIPPLENFRLTYGQGAYRLLLILALTVGTMIGSLVYMALSNLLKIRFSKKKINIKKH